MIILWDNEVDKNTVSALTEHVDFPLTNLVYPHLSRVYRSTADADQWIKIAGTDIKANSISILNHNLTNAATIKIQGNDTDTWAAPSLDVTLTWAEYTIFQEFTSGEYDYWRLSINDAANPDNYISIGRLFLGEILEMPAMKIDQGIDDNITDKLSFSESGQVYGDEVILFRGFTVNYPYISETQRTAIREAFKSMRTHKPFVMKLWDDDNRELAVYCVFSAIPKWKRSTDRNNLWQLEMTFREVF